MRPFVLRASFVLCVLALVSSRGASYGRDILGSGPAVASAERPLSHLNLVMKGNTYYDSLVSGVEVCHTFTLSNPNSFPVTLLHIQDAPAGQFLNYYMTKNTPTFPYVLGSNAEISFDLCVTADDAAGMDSTRLGSWLSVLYDYGGGTDSVFTVTSGKDYHYNTCLSFACSLDAKEGGAILGRGALSNNTNSTLMIDSIKIADDTYGAFQYFGSIPLIFSPHYIDNLQIAFNPPVPAPSARYTATFEVWSHGIWSNSNITCTMQSFPIEGILDIPEDSLYLDVPPGQNTIDVIANSGWSEHSLFFHNVGSGSLKYLSVSIPDTCRIAYLETPDNFSHAVSDTVIPGATGHTPSRLFIHVSDTGTYPIDVTLQYTNALQTTHYTINVHSGVLHIASVPDIVPTTDFSVYPNPASGSVSIYLPDNTPSTIDVYDILGNRVLQQEAAGEMTWSPKAAAGIYIVRVTQHLATGSVATSSKRLVFDK